MLDERQQFKVAFLKKMAQMGVTLDELEVLLEKQAFIPGLKQVADLGATGLKYLAGGLLATGPLIGIAGGMAAAKSRGLGHEETPEEEKQRELIDAYRNATEQVRLADQAQRVKNKSRSGSSFGVI